MARPPAQLKSHCPDHPRATGGERPFLANRCAQNMRRVSTRASTTAVLPDSSQLRETFGSSPRGRGTRGPVHFVAVAAVRIIPAQAGNAARRPSLHRRSFTDHPRVGGERCCSSRTLMIGSTGNADSLGSDHPRVGGEHSEFRGVDGTVRRIIPAWAGNTLRRVGQERPPTGSSPRGRGTRAANSASLASPRGRGTHAPDAGSSPRGRGTLADG